MGDRARGFSSQSEIGICYSFGMAGTSEEGRFSRRTEWKLAPNRLTEALLEERAAGREVLDLTLSNPTHAGILSRERAGDRGGDRPLRLPSASATGAARARDAVDRSDKHDQPAPGAARESRQNVRSARPLRAASPL